MSASVIFLLVVPGVLSTRKTTTKTGNRTYEAFRGHIGGSKTTGSLVGVDNQPRGAILVIIELVELSFLSTRTTPPFHPPIFFFCLRRPQLDNSRKTREIETYDLVETLSSTETSRASTNDENVNGTENQWLAVWKLRCRGGMNLEHTCRGGSFCLVGGPGS